MPSPSESGEVAAVTMVDRLIVAGVASHLIDLDQERYGKLLLDAVRCCGEFPECSHVLAEYEKEKANV